MWPIGRRLCKRGVDAGEVQFSCLSRYFVISKSKPRDSVRILKVELEKNQEKESGRVEVEVERLNNVEG
jgi:hypothetical protein